jgi:hypothetical protein
MRFKESCSSLNTEVAPIRNTTMPMPAAIDRRDGSLALAISPSRARAPLAPIRPDSWATDLAPDRFGTEEVSGHRCDYQEQGRDGKHRVKCKGRAHAWGIIFSPRRKSLRHQLPTPRHARFHSMIFPA